MPDQDWKALAESLTEGALILRLKSTEHDFVERKPRGQKGEWLQTAVAFANSAPIGWPAVLFVGVDDKGTPQQQADQLPAMLNTVSGVIDQAYPPIYRHVIPIDISGEGACLAVIVPGSPSRPHFAGQSYVRVGDQTRSASEEQFATLISQRNSKGYEISKWIGKTVSRWHFSEKPNRDREIQTRSDDFILVACNAHYLTLESDPHRANRYTESIPLEWVELSYDHPKHRLAVCVEYLGRKHGP